MYYKRNPVDGKIQAAEASAYNPAGLNDGEVKGKLNGQIQLNSVT